jgi:endonuclease G
MIKQTLALTLFMFSSYSYANHCLHSCPSGKSGQLVTRQIYSLQNNASTKFADWVAYKVTKATIDGPSRGRSWKADPALNAAHTLEPADYTDASASLGVDRGHQVPLASFSNSPYWADTNYLSNITPQAAALNQGAWVKLENAERTLARSGKTVYVISGPLYEWNFGTLPGADESHRIPSGYFKVLMVQSSKGIDTAAYIMEQDLSRSASFCPQLVSIDEVEQRSGLNLMPALSTSQASSIEADLGVLSSQLGCR